MIGVSQERAPTASQWREISIHLYYLPIVIAALYDGWRIGVVIAALATISLLAPVFPHEPMGSSLSRAQHVDPVLFCAIALLIGRYTDRARQEKHKHQLLAEQLADVYEKLQTNFDGMKRAERLSAIGQFRPASRTRFAIRSRVSRGSIDPTQERAA